MELGLFLLHVVPGLLLMGHGSQKLFGWLGGLRTRGHRPVHGLARHAPGKRMALAAGFNEFAGGLLLALGLADPAGGGPDRLDDAGRIAHGASRQGALGHQQRVRAAAAVRPHRRSPSPFNGAGQWSLDHAIGWDVRRPRLGPRCPRRSRSLGAVTVVARSPAQRAGARRTASRPPASRTRHSRHRTKAPPPRGAFACRRLALLEDGVPLGQQRAARGGPRPRP